MTFLRIACFLFFILILNQKTTAQKSPLIIAHRGGVVDSTYTENGLSALKKAIQEKFSMIETDVRLTRDGILIAQHDADFKRFYGVDKKVTEMDWAEIKTLRSKLDQNGLLLLEDVLRLCKENRTGVMLDIKITGMDTAVFEKMIALLDQYNLRKSALAIGTDESKEFLTGKIRLSCSRKQLEENMQKPGYRAAHYYLFERPSKLTREDADWASKNNILTIAAVNKYHYRNAQDMLSAAEQDCRTMLRYGIRNFQIDSEFRQFVK